MRVARPVELSAEQQETLESRARARSAAARSVERARIVLLAAAGMQDKQIAAKLESFTIGQEYSEMIEPVRSSMIAGSQEFAHSAFPDPDLVTSRNVL